MLFHRSPQKSGFGCPGALWRPSALHFQALGCAAAQKKILISGAKNSPPTSLDGVSSDKIPGSNILRDIDNVSADSKEAPV